MIPQTLTRQTVAPVRSPGMIVALMVALSAMSYFERTIMSIAGPVIIKELDISPTRMGTVYSAFLLSYSLSMVPLSPLADRFGPRILLTVFGFGMSLFTGLTALCGGPVFSSIFGVAGSFLLIRLLFGVFTSPLYPACGRMTSNWIPASDTGRVQGLIMSAAALGGAISPVTFAWMISRFGWRNAFWLAGLASAALFAIWFFCVRDFPSNASHPAMPERRGFPWKELVTNRGLLLLTISYFGLNYFEYIFFYWIYYYFGEIRHMGTRESAIYVSILMLTMVVMTPFGGWISDRLVARYGRRSGRRIVPIVAMTASAGLLIIGASGLGTFATVALLSLAFGCAASAEGTFWASGIEIGGANVAAACGFLNAGGNVGGLFAPVVTPMLAARFGWTWGLYGGSAVVALAVLLWFFIQVEAPPAGRLRR